MKKRGLTRVTLVIMIILFLSIIILFFKLTQNTPSINANASGGGAVSITTIELSEKGEIFDGTISRLKFKFNEKWYAIQVRDIRKYDNVTFITMTLDMNNLDDITAFTLDDTFILEPEDTKEIDIDKDGNNDIFIELYNITDKDLGSPFGYRTLPDFSIKLIACTEDWECIEWGECTNKIKGRTCIDKNDCGTEYDKPLTSKVCVSEEIEKEPETETEIFIKNSRVFIEKDSEGINILKIGESSIKSSLEIIWNLQKVYVKTSSGNRELKILPEEAISKAEKIDNLDEIKIEEENGKGVYSISGTKRARLFFIIPILIEVEQKVNVETGEIESIKESWWSFLAWKI